VNLLMLGLEDYNFHQNNIQNLTQLYFT